MNPASWLYSKITEAKYWTYKKGFVSSLKLPVPVISVGNLSVGGTGKTPVIALIVDEFLKNGKRVGLVSRAYKAKSSDPVKVSVRQPNAAQIFGDEAVMLAKKYPEVPVYVGRSKFAIAQKLVRSENVDLVLVDDGFQHLALARDLDIVLIDVSKQISHYQVLPSGRLREPMTALTRAHFIIFTKSQFANAELLKWLETQACFKTDHAFLEQRLELPRSMKSNMEVAASAIGKKSLAVCGLADPESFLRLLKISFPSVVFESVRFSDHHKYSQQDIEKIEKCRLEKKCDSIVVTEKDAVKINELVSLNQEHWFACPLKLKFTKGEHEFYERLGKIVT